VFSNALHQFPRSKSVTSWHGQKSAVSVVSCRFSNSITTTQQTFYGLVSEILACQDSLLAVSLTSPQQVANFPVYGEVTGKRV